VVKELRVEEGSRVGEEIGFEVGKRVRVKGWEKGEGWVKGVGLKVIKG
jgi:hypothetical protein